jgi:hypothetical protein
VKGPVGILPSLLVGLGILASKSAHAQNILWPPEQVEEQVTDQQQIRLVARSFAKCVVRKHPKEAAQVVVSATGNEQLIKNYKRLMDGDCLVSASRSGNNTEMSLPGSQLRYLLADALVLRDYLVEFPAQISLAPPLVHPSRVTEAPVNQGKALSPEKLAARQKLFALDAATIVFGKLGECVVRDDAAAVHRLLITEPTSADEKAAFTLLRPSLGRCLPKGQTLKLTFSATRGTLAENFYRLAKTAPVAPSGANR